MTSEKDAPAEMPGVEEIARLVDDYAFKSWQQAHDYEMKTTGDAEEAVKFADWSAGKRVSEARDKARAILALFAPILAETERATVKRIAQVASEVAAQAGVGASETAGLIVSVLAANPEHTERFMTEGSELFIDGTIRPEKGCLSHMAMNGQVVSPTKLRMMKGQSQ